MRAIIRTHRSLDYGVVDHFSLELIEEAEGNQIGLIDLSCHPECPEDNNFERDLSDIFNLRGILEAVYYAGKMGEDLTFSELPEEL